MVLGEIEIINTTSSESKREMCHAEQVFELGFLVCNFEGNERL